jgi:hypothetical protein
MNKMLFFLLSIFLSCNDRQSLCDKLTEGSFDLYEDGVFVGKLFRKNNFQIEKYADKQSYTIGKLRRINTCQFYLNHNVVKKPMDTITWLITYTPLEKDTFEISAKSAYIDTLKYIYKGKMVKINNELNPEINKLIEELCNW